MNRIQTIVEKEWAEVFKNRIVLFTVAFLPILFTALPLIILYTTRGAASAGDSADLPPSFAKACVAIASYSIVGEKASRSLEPLLATPITTPELLAGKSLAAAVPAILATWLGFVVFVIDVPFVGGGPAIITSILGSVWLTAIFVVGPLMAVMAVNFAIMVSSRVNDPRAAEQISAVVVVPILGLMFGQIAGVIALNVQLMMFTALVLAIIDVGLIYLGARLFQRETILTKWK